MIESNTNIESEVKILKSLKHPNIVEFIGLKKLNGEKYIIMEYMNGGNLLAYVRSHDESLKENELMDMAQQIANGMSYLEEQKIIHK